MPATVSHIIQCMESIAPGHLAEEWDNVGLQVGQRDWPVKKVWIALDPTLDVLKAAGTHRVDMLVTHHPIIFRPLTHVDPSSPTGAIFTYALEHRIALFVAHTNLDTASGGVNDLLCERIGVVPLRPLQEIPKQAFYKFVVYVPREHETRILETMIAGTAGTIGHYTDCTFRMKGMGSFRPHKAARPFAGSRGQLTHVEETRVETLVSSNELPGLIEQVRNVHPYEEMAFDVLPTTAPDRDTGLGRVGTLSNPMTLKAFSESIARGLKLSSVRIAGPPELMVHDIAVCSGSGASLMSSFLSSGAQVYVSGDLKYHDARTAEAAGVGLIDIGHFASEHIIVGVLAETLSRTLGPAHADILVEAYRGEIDPFRQIGGKENG